jgi:hypothetical protein
MTIRKICAGTRFELDRSVRAALAVALLLVPLLLSHGLRAEETPSDVAAFWTVIAVSGTARQLPSLNAWNEAKPLAPGNLVAPSNIVTTSPGSEATLMRASDILVIYANAAVRLPEPRAPGVRAQAEQISGDVFYLIEPMEAAPFEAVTPYFTVGVRGTRFLITNFGRTVVVTQGRVLVTAAASGASAEVNGGSAGFVGDPAASRVIVSRAPGAAINLWETRSQQIRAGASVPR